MGWQMTLFICFLSTATTRSFNSLRPTFASRQLSSVWKRSHVLTSSTSRHIRAKQLSATKAPEVEISPSDHGISPIDTFEQLDSRIGKSLQAKGWTTPTTIQAFGIPLVLETNSDLMASSQTGSGKSLMFCLPLLQRLLEIQSNPTRTRIRKGAPHALVISPTRELAAQTADVLRTVCHPTLPSLRVSLATGGENLKKQRQQLANSNILVGTPGRILQFIDERQLFLGQDTLQFLVIDEADRLMDLGFEPQLTRIARMIRRRNGREKVDDDDDRHHHHHQTILCSATFPPSVQQIASDFLRKDYYFISVGRVGSTHSKIEQHVEWAEDSRKAKAVVRHVNDFRSKAARHKSSQGSVIVFANTKDDVEKFGKALRDANLKNRVIHGDKIQATRNQILKDFANAKVPILVATDVAARGLDITSIGLIVQADAPRDADTYTHRVGRTGRAGASGKAVTLVNAKNMGIASELADLLSESNHQVPAWLQGMSHTTQARQVEEEELLVHAGGTSTKLNETNKVNEGFSDQDFRRTAIEGSYGADRDTSYRSFDDEAYAGIESVSTDVSRPDSGEATVGAVEKASENAQAITEEVAFQRQQPSRSLKDTVEAITGSNQIGDTFDEKVFSALSRKGESQKLRLEYLGLFPFQTVVKYLTRPKGNDHFEGMPTILMVAEKPSIAKAVADALSGKTGPRQKRGISRALPVDQFVSSSFAPLNESMGQPTACRILVTSVVGHILSLGFDRSKEEGHSDPRTYFQQAVVKQEEGTSLKLRVVDHLRALASGADHLVLWLDCDAEGENIAHEVMAVTRKSMADRNDVSTSGGSLRRIHRAKFSAITPKALKDAFGALVEPDSELSRSVDARQELDLRVGVALTRLLTWRCVGIARKKFDPKTRLVSYGPCQTPALSFCVDRAKEIENFQPDAYWELMMDITDGRKPVAAQLRWKVDPGQAVPNNRDSGGNEYVDNASFDRQAVDMLVREAQQNGELLVASVETTKGQRPPPVALNTVALLQAGSKAMGMSPKQVMSTAEKLYSMGYISYPRTETTRYDPNGFDVRVSLRQHSQHEVWGKSATHLLRTKYAKNGKPPRRGFDAGDHPPITPLRSASRGEIGGGAAWRVYEFIVRTFLGSLHDELIYTSVKTTLQMENRQEQTEFEFELLQTLIEEPGFSVVCNWILSDMGVKGKRENQQIFNVGHTLEVKNVCVSQRKTRPARFLQEHELIKLMDENRIGTDASMAIHVNNIVDRGYVVLCDQSGIPLRPPRPPRAGQKPPPRQIGRYMVPTSLGMNLLGLFSASKQSDTTEQLAQPRIRRTMEEEVKQIAQGSRDKEECLKSNLEWFEERYCEVAASLDDPKVRHNFGSELMQNRQMLQYWRAKDAFEEVTSSARTYAGKKSAPKAQRGKRNNIKATYQKPTSKGTRTSKNSRNKQRTR